jgi:xanthine/uracil permease
MGVLASLLPDPFIRQLPAYLRPILGNGLIVGVIFVLLLEHVVMKENRAQA